MDPKKRTLLQVTLIADDRKDTEKSVERLMGTKPETRFAFIQERAEFADEAVLDVRIFSLSFGDLVRRSVRNMPVWNVGMRNCSCIKQTVDCLLDILMLGCRRLDVGVACAIDPCRCSGQHLPTPCR